MLTLYLGSFVFILFYTTLTDASQSSEQKRNPPTAEQPGIELALLDSKKIYRSIDVRPNQDNMSAPIILQPSRLNVMTETAAKNTEPAPLYIYMVSLASLFIVIGLMWDISWHKSIGRDGLFSPPHILIYLGAILAGLVSGIQILHSSFWATSEVKKSLIRVWGVFYSSLGAMFCVWGAIAMLTSAPFDDWWHSTYGLDVVVLSPPHSLLGLGIFSLEFGACISLCKYLNRTVTEPSQLSAKAKRILDFLFVVTAACFITSLCLLLQGFFDTRYQRISFFYEISSVVFLFFLPAFGATLQTRWSMTTIALLYFLIWNACNWVLQLFPAEPKLGPVLNHITHFQPLQFPLLLFFPSVVADIVMRKRARGNWAKAFFLSLSFISVFVLVQYPISKFLFQSPIAHNWFFCGDSWNFNADPDWQYRYQYMISEQEPLFSFLKGLGTAVLLGTFAARGGLGVSHWLKKILR